jgi:hypothetical protein
VSERPAEDERARDIDRAIEELAAAAKVLDTPEVRRTLKALSDAAKAVATIQDAVTSVALQDAAKAVALQDAAKAVALQDAAKAVALQDAAKAVALQDAAKAVALQDAARTAASSTSSISLRELVAEEVRRALALSGQAAQQAGDQPKSGK